MVSRPCIGVFAFALFSLVCASDVVAQPFLLDYLNDYGSDRIEHPYGIAVDASDNVFVVGSSTGALSMGGATFTSIGNQGVHVLAKYDPSGAHLWSIGIGEAVGSMQVWELATDAAGDVLLCGRTFFGPIDFGGGPIGGTDTGDAFVAKFSGATGAHLWSQSFGDDGNIQHARGVTADPSGNVILVGDFRGTIDFGGGPLAATVGSDLFLAKFSSAGAHVWSTSFPDPLSVYSESVTTDGAGNIFVGGGFAEVDFGGGTIVAPSGFDGFLVKFDPSGAWLWNTTFPAVTSATVLSVDADAAGNVVFSGEMRDGVTVGTSVLPGVGGTDGFLGRCDASGAVEWGRSVSGTSNDRIAHVRIGPGGDVYANGFFYLSADVDGGPSMTGPASDLSHFVLAYSSAGTHQWNHFVTATAQFMHFDVDSVGDFYAFGEYSAPIDVGGVVLTPIDLTDLFVSKWTPEGPVSNLVRSFAARVVGSGVEIGWSLSGVETGARYAVVRAEAGAPDVVVDEGQLVMEGRLRDDGVRAGRSYEYSLRITAADGAVRSNVLARVSVPRMIASLEQNAPNPFNPRTSIAFTVAAPGRATIEVFDLSGARVRQLDAGDVGVGTHTVEWDGTDDAGRKVATGTYVYRLAGAPASASRKMTLVK